MPGNTRTIDESVKDEILRYPTVELVKKLFPDVKIRGSVLCNPLRGEQHPSFSCFRTEVGYSRWKDHATGETGDNISFYREAFPGLDYVSAIDQLAWLVLGRSALIEGGSVQRMDTPAVRPRKHIHHEAETTQPALKILSVEAIRPEPGDTLLEYCHHRGISTAVAVKYLKKVTFENKNVSGRFILDETTGTPLLGGDGQPLRSDGRQAALGLPNDIGGYSLRTPPSKERTGFKGCNSSFFSLILADGLRPSQKVRFTGKKGVPFEPEYLQHTQELRAGRDSVFRNVLPTTVNTAWPLLKQLSGTCLPERSLRCLCALLTAMNAPHTEDLTVVEGMFDALSVIELQLRGGFPGTPGTDLLVLNSTSNIDWAVPLLSMYLNVRSLLDIDERSATGQKKFYEMKSKTEEYGRNLGHDTQVYSCSDTFSPFKDINEYLQSLTTNID